MKVWRAQLFDRGNGAIAFVDIHAGVAVQDLIFGGQIPVYGPADPLAGETRVKPDEKRLGL